MSDIFELFKQIAHKNPASAQPAEWLFVGLGNPGEEYRNTRHNAGFRTLDALAEQQHTQIDRMRFHALTGETVIAGKKVLLLKPMTFMNSSGIAVREAADFYKIPPEKILVCSDDISLVPGKMRLRRKGSAGGHNGLKSIIEHLGTEDFPRLKLGVGAKPHPDYDLADWVLSNFTDAENSALNSAIRCAADGYPLLLSGNFDAAVQHFNSHTPGEK